MTDSTPPEASFLELIWLEAVGLIEDQHPALVERVTDPQAERARLAILKQLGQDLVICAAATGQSWTSEGVRPQLDCRLTRQGQVYRGKKLDD